MTSISSLTFGLFGDDQLQTMEDELLKKWGVHIELSEMLNSDADTLCGQCTAIDGHTETTDIGGVITNGNDDNMYKQAFEAYTKGQYCDSLIYLDDALESPDNINTGKLFTLKTKVLNAMEDHLEALRSAVCVEKGVRSFELLIEAAKSLDKLGLVLTAERLLKKVVIATSQDQVNAKASYEFLQDVHNRRIYQSYIKNLPIIVRRSDKGKGLAVKTRISKNSVIFKELPELCDQTMSSDSIAACSHCGFSLVRPDHVFSKGHLAVPGLQRAIKKYWLKRPVTPCKVCDRVVYCSETCRQEALEKYHKVICPSSPNSSTAMLYDVRKSFRDVIPTDGLAWQGWWNADFSPTLLAKVWSAIISTAKSESQDGDKVPTQKLKMASAQFDKYSNSNKDSRESHKETHESIHKMFELMVNIFKRSKVVRYEISPDDFNKRHCQILSNFIQFHDTKDPLNCFADKMKQDPKLYRKIGQFFTDNLTRAEFHGLFPLASLINHSCVSNADLVSGEVEGKPGIWVKANQEIHEGQEIFISYVSPELPRMERRLKLWSRYKFVCQCTKCMFEGDGPHECSYCSKKADDCLEKGSSDRNNTEEPGIDEQQSKVDKGDLAEKVKQLLLSSDPNIINQGQQLSNSPLCNDAISSLSTNEDVIRSKSEMLNEHVREAIPDEFLTTKSKHDNCSTKSDEGTQNHVDVDDKRPKQEVNNDVTATVNKEVTADVTKEVTADVTKEVTADVTKEVTADVTKEATKEVTADVTKEVTADVTKEVTADVTKEANKEVTADVTKEVTTDVTKEVTADVTKEATKEVTTDVTKEVTTDVTKEVTTDVTKEVTTDVTREVTKDVTKEVTTDVTKEVTTDVTKEVTTDVTKEVTTDVTKEVTTDVTKEVTTDATKEVTTDVTKEVTTDVTKEVTTDVTKKIKFYPHCGRCARAWYCSLTCQKEAWKKGHKLICKKLK